MIRYLFVAALLVIAATRNTSAQTPVCGSDLLRTHYTNTKPELLDKESIVNQQLFQRIISNSGSASQQGIPYVIPVVFHIMHDNGPENVADSVIENAVDELNLRYQNAPAYYDSTGHPVNIQFCLATVDPQGNPSTGITRYATNYTYFTFPYDDQSLKNLDRWSPDLYYNVWVVFNISGFIDGYSSFPFYAGQSIDGVVIEYLYITNSYLLAHETAHYCGLYHTFQDGCNNYNCLLNGDKVCDTPPDNSSTGFPCMSNSCQTEMQDTSGLNPFTSDVNELPNYMDYTTCPLSFTQGQCDRMENSVSLMRSSLFISNGCGNNPGQVAPVAAFSFSGSGCNDGIISFSDSSSVNSLTSEWDFNNDGAYDTLAHTFNYTFPATGIYTITLRVTGVGGQDSITQVVSVKKGSTFNYPIIDYPGAITDTIAVCQGDSVTIQGDPSGSSYLWSTGDTTSTITIAADTSIAISLLMTDTTGFTWSTQCTPLYMEVYPVNIPNITYDDTVGYLCQGELLDLYITNPIPGLYTWWVYHISTGWFNTGDHNDHYSIYPDPANGHQFYVTYSNAAGCNATSNYLLVQPQFLPYLNGVPLTVQGYTLSYSGTGYLSQWYKDGIPIPGATSNFYTATQTGCYNMLAWYSAYPACSSYTDTVCFLFSGIDESTDEGIVVSPNPSADQFHISIADGFKGNETITVWNMLGERIFGDAIKSGERSYILNAGAWPEGIYLLEITSSGESRLLHKLVVSGK